MDSDQKKVTQRQIATISDYRKVFGTDQGKRVLWDICKNAQILTPCYTGKAEEAIFRDGERNVALRILSTLKYDPKQLIELLEQEDKENV